MRLLALSLCSLLPVALATAAAAQPADVKRVLRTFDFEERRLGNNENPPMHWAKGEGAGPPHYVNGKLATDSARGGQFSLRVDLNGGRGRPPPPPRRVQVP